MKCPYELHDRRGHTQRGKNGNQKKKQKDTYNILIEPTKHNAGFNEDLRFHNNYNDTGGEQAKRKVLDETPPKRPPLVLVEEKSGWLIGVIVVSF
jgi:hypothetical protein